jgi:tetratricopeptide (TPR) repeat protein
VSEISNPYIAGAPVVESSMFFGREDVFNWIERSLAGKYVNHILVLHGQRRVGKTSVLKQIPNFLPKNYIQVFFDLQGRTSTSLDRFLWWLASEIVRTLKKERDIDLPRPDRKAFEDTEYLIGEFLPSLRLILGEQILILTFDEFDTIDQPEIQESLAQPLIAYLRRLMEMDGLNFVFSIGSSGDKLENMQASYTDFFKSALYRKISFLTRDDCHRLITKPVEGVIQYDRKAVERIIEITSGHPYFTQLMCHELFALCQKTGERQIRAEDVEAILGDVIERGTVNLKFVWDEASDLEKWILAGIAMLDGGTSTQKLGHLLQEQRVRFSDADLNAAIIHLRDKDVLDQDNHFVIQLMRMWLQANRPLDRVREELAEVNPIANRYIEIGDEYRDRGQSSQAIESYQQAIQADPGNLKAQFNIGAVHLEGGAYTQAAAAFELALQIDDEDVGARTGYCNATLALGDAARAEHQVETAIGYYEKILLFNPAHGDARLRLAEIYQQRAEASLAAGQDDAALSAFNQAMDYTPENETLAARYDEVLAQKKAKVTAEWMGRAERAQARQRWDEAAGFVEEALKLDPQNEALQAKLLEVKDAPRQEKIRGYRQEAEQAIKRGNFEKAVGALETALLLSPGDETIISWLESARSNQRNAQLLLIREQVKRAVTAGDWEAAIQFIEKAQKTAPQQEDWDKQLAGIQAARHQAQLKACRQEADRARSAGNWDDAITALQKYRQLEPSQVEIETEIEAIRLEKHQSQLLAHKTQAEKAARAEEWDEAMIAWESYLKLEPDDQAAAEKSLLQARKYAKISTDYAAAQESMRKKRYGRAIELLQGIIAQEPTYKSTSRLLVEAVEANKAIPFWRRGVVWAGLAVAFLLIASIGIGVVWLGQQNFPFLITGKVTPTTTSTSTPTRMVTLTSTATRMVTPSFTPTPAIDPTIQDALDTIRNEAPLYQTSFDDWDTDDTGRNAALVNGKLILTSEDENGSHLSLFEYPSDRYVVEYEVSIVGDASSSNGVCLYGASNGYPIGESYRGFTAEFLPGEDLAVLARYVHQLGGDERIVTAPFDKTKSNVVRLVVLGDQFTAFINGQLAYTAQNPAGSVVYVQHSFSAFNQVTCGFDHFKYWDLRDLDSAVKSALAAIQNEEPYYQTNFDIWDFGEPIENGLINNGKLLLDGKNQDVDFLINKLTSNSFVIELEFRILPEANLQGHCIVGAENNFGSTFHAAFYRDFADLAYYFSQGQGNTIASTSYADMELNL